MPGINLNEEQDLDGYKSIFGRWFTAKMQDKVIDMIFESYKSRITKEDGMYVIDDFFSVDSHGVSHYRNKINGKWNHLCLVAQNAEPQKILQPDGTTFEANVITITMIAKMMYLLHPKPDNVVKSQLPQFLNERLRKQASVDVRS